MQARYLMIADHLMQDIADGTFQVGTTLPGEIDLCSRFGVARNTVRQAIQVLREKGLVSSEKGVGTIILADQTVPKYVHTIDSLDSWFDYLKVTRLHIISINKVTAHNTVSQFLRAKEGTQWIDVTAVRYSAKKEGISFSHLYIPEIYRAVVSKMDGLDKPSYTLLEKLYDCRVIQVDQRATVSGMPGEAAKLLHTTPESPAQVVDRHYFAEGRQVLMASRSFYPPEKFSVSVQLRLVRDGSNGLKLNLDR